VLFSFDGKQQVTYLKGIDQNFTTTNKASQNYSMANGSNQTRINVLLDMVFPKNYL